MTDIKKKKRRRKQGKLPDSHRMAGTNELSIEFSVKFHWMISGYWGSQWSLHNQEKFKEIQYSSLEVVEVSRTCLLTVLFGSTGYKKLRDIWEKESNRLWEKLYVVQDGGSGTGCLDWVY